MDLKTKNSVKKMSNEKYTPTSNDKYTSHSYRKINTPKNYSQNKTAIHKTEKNNKKIQQNTLHRKNIHQLKPPQLIIKAIYKAKKYQSQSIISIIRTSNKPFYHISNASKNKSQFKSTQIDNWKIFGKSDILKDYYFQTNKSLSVFKGEVLEVQPIWKVPSPQHLSLANLQIIKCIGTGGFSQVFLVRMKHTGNFYALKLMEKQGLIESGKECVVVNERDIMIGLDNPFIVKLQFAFETKHFVALGLQYCPGGQLFHYLRKVRRMSEEDARFCFVQILLGIQYLHSKQIIYRDIKPENIMIDMNGNLKIADFGLSRIGLQARQLAYTYCGSPQYMAPEMLSKSGHSYSVDYYCLGALLYELVTGNPPFYSQNVQKIYYSIQNEEIDFPDNINLTPQIKMLLESLLLKDPKKRLGSLSGIREILGHPWVRKIKATDITQKIVTTPIKIDLLTFNVNEEQVNQYQNKFIDKFNDQNGDFEPMFEDFYYYPTQPLKILDDILTSAKSESTKQHKSLNSKVKYQRQKSKQKNLRLPSKDKKIHIMHLKSQSKSNRQLSKTSLTKIHKIKTKKKLNLIQKAKKKDYKQKSVGKKHKLNYTPKWTKQNTLKRIKSSLAIIGQPHTIKQSLH